MFYKYIIFITGNSRLWHNFNRYTSHIFTVKDNSISVRICPTCMFFDGWRTPEHLGRTHKLHKKPRFYLRIKPWTTCCEEIVLTRSHSVAPLLDQKLYWWRQNAGKCVTMSAYKILISLSSLAVLQKLFEEPLIRWDLQLGQRSVLFIACIITENNSNLWLAFMT